MMFGLIVFNHLVLLLCRLSRLRLASAAVNEKLIGSYYAGMLAENKSRAIFQCRTVTS